MKICHCSAASNHLVTMDGVTTTSGDQIIFNTLSNDNSLNIYS